MLFYQSLQTTSWLECSSCLSKFPEVTGHSTRRLFRGQKMQSETSIRMSRGTGLLRVATQKRSRPFLKTFATVFPPRGGVVATPLRFSRFFFQDDKTSAPEAFYSYLFIPRAHFETSLVMVSYYGYKIWRHKWQVIKPFLNETACFFYTSFRNKSKPYG